MPLVRTMVNEVLAENDTVVLADVVQHLHACDARHQQIEEHDVRDILTESLTSLAPSGNPLEILPPRERAVLVLLGSGLDATTVAKLLHVSRETLIRTAGARGGPWRRLSQAAC